MDATALPGSGGAHRRVQAANHPVVCADGRGRTAARDEGEGLLATTA